MKKTDLKNKPSMSIREIAQLADVSPSTVSRILNDPQGLIPFAPQTRERIVELCRQRGYQPNVHAKRLFAGRSHVLAMAVPPVNQRMAQWTKREAPNFTLSLAGIEEQATLNNHDLLLVTVNEQFLERKKYQSLFTSRAIDGMLIWGGLFDESYINELFKSNYPIVMVGTRHNNSRIPNVGVDNRQAGTQIAKHLIELGHRHIAYLSGLQCASAAQERCEAFCQTCEQHNIPVTVCEGEFSYASGYALAEQLLNQKQPPTAIGTANDIVAIGALEAAATRGLQIPSDLSVASLEEQMPFYNPRLTTIEMPIYETGAHATRLLMQLIEASVDSSSSHLQKQQILPVTFKQGQTTAPPEFPSKSPPDSRPTNSSISGD